MSRITYLLGTILSRKENQLSILLGSNDFGVHQLTPNISEDGVDVLVCVANRKPRQDHLACQTLRNEKLANSESSLSGVLHTSIYLVIDGIWQSVVVCFVLFFQTQEPAMITEISST